MNLQLTRFLDTIRGEGFGITLNWEAKRWKGDKGGVRHYTVHGGPEGQRPAMLTFIVTDYGPDDGFGLYGDSDASTTIAGAVAAVTGAPEDEVSLVA